jgi:hypothetical protein
MLNHIIERTSQRTVGTRVARRTDLITTAIPVACKAALVAAAVCLYVALARPHYDAIIVLACATLSSVAGFAFSALSGPALLHAIGDPVKAVHIMLVASVAPRNLSHSFESAKPSFFSGRE